MTSTTIFQDITENFEKVTYFFSHNFGGVIAPQGVICHPRVKKMC